MIPTTQQLITIAKKTPASLIQKEAKFCDPIFTIAIMVLEAIPYEIQKSYNFENRTYLLRPMRPKQQKAHFWHAKKMEQLQKSTSEQLALRHLSHLIPVWCLRNSFCAKLICHFSLDICLFI